MNKFRDPDPGRPHDGVDLPELDESFQLLAAAATAEELEMVAEQLGGDQAALLKRLAKHFSKSPADPAVAADGHAIPDRVGRFTILREIGSGGFGVVYLARDETIGREVAVKLPRRDLIRDTLRRQQLVHEARTAGALEHPNIIPVYESGTDGEMVYIVSAYCDGPDLASWQSLQRQQSTSIEAAVFVSKLANAVAYAHAQGVVHRDIKPSNVLLAREPSLTDSNEVHDPKASNSSLPLSRYQPRLTDFGLAQRSDEPITDTRSSLIVGTPLYMAPEQLLPDLGPVTAQTDIYSLGVLLVELLIGQPMLSGKTYIEILSIFQNESPAYKQLVPIHIPSDLRTIIIKCLSRTPENRFVSADALAQDLDAFVGGRPVSARNATWLNRTITWCRDAKRTREACLFTLAAIACMTTWVLYSLTLVWGPTFPGQDAWGPTVQAMAIVGIINVPIVIFAYLGLGQRLWAMKVALAWLLVGSVIVPGLVVVGAIGLLDPIYGPYPYFRKSFHSLIMLVGFAQVIYLAVGLYAHHWNTKRHVSW
ncbi:Serine/threonine-protein kinase PrkC [Novipirellula galeiformis]|uniref:Serine/threonine-protein kinase PrkC n=1 Tax=Novipirellula galeiformis TaxID=2528004 RepID=A0A5C6CL63_9BACT|nr:serine/threonine-protein kinase [Novipirellula galeiformis]TWU24815.1 Serine/threonine-protein kinase PrkC [Novipirellula galeiformis]